MITQTRGREHPWIEDQHRRPTALMRVGRMPATATRGRHDAAYIATRPDAAIALVNDIEEHRPWIRGRRRVQNLANLAARVDMGHRGGGCGYGREKAPVGLRLPHVALAASRSLQPMVLGAGGCFTATLGGAAPVVRFGDDISRTRLGRTWFDGLLDPIAAAAERLGYAMHLE